MSRDDFDKLEGMIIKLDDRIDNVDKTLVRNTVSLEEHVKRTDMLESYVKERVSYVNGEFEPIKKHVNQVTYGVRAIFWFCSVVASIAGFFYLLKQLSLL